MYENYRSVYLALLYLLQIYSTIHLSEIFVRNILLWNLLCASDMLPYFVSFCLHLCTIKHYPSTLLCYSYRYWLIYIVSGLKSASKFPLYSSRTSFIGRGLCLRESQHRSNHFSSLRRIWMREEDDNLGKESALDMIYLTIYKCVSTVRTWTVANHIGGQLLFILVLLLVLNYLYLFLPRFPLWPFHLHIGHTCGLYSMPCAGQRFYGPYGDVPQRIHFVKETPYELFVRTISPKYSLVLKNEIRRVTLQIELLLRKTWKYSYYDHHDSHYHCSPLYRYKELDDACYKHYCHRNSDLSRCNDSSQSCNC